MKERSRWWRERNQLKSEILHTIWHQYFSEALSLAYSMQLMSFEDSVPQRLLSLNIHKSKWATRCHACTWTYKYQRLSVNNVYKQDYNNVYKQDYILLTTRISYTVWPSDILYTFIWYTSRNIKLVLLKVAQSCSTYFHYPAHLNVSVIKSI